MVTPGVTGPWGSVTLTRIEPVCTCAMAGAATPAASNTATHNIRLMGILLKSHAHDQRSPQPAELLKSATEDDRWGRARSGGLAAHPTVRILELERRAEHDRPRSEDLHRRQELLQRRALAG